MTLLGCGRGGVEEYTAGTADVLTGLLAYYRLGEDTLDSSGSGRHLTGGSPSFSFDAGPLSDGACMVSGTPALAVSLPATAYTLSVWFGTAGGTMGGSSPGYVRLDRDNGGTEHLFSLIWQRTPTRNCYAGVALEASQFATSGLSNSWHHFVAASDGTTLRGWLDGAPLGESAVIPPAATITLVQVVANAKAYCQHAAVYGRYLGEGGALRLYNGGLGFDPTA